MATSDITRLTPITTRADRHDERVRLIEESVLLLRGDWPAVATGLCESINSHSPASPTPTTSKPGPFDLNRDPETTVRTLPLGAIAM